MSEWFESWFDSPYYNVLYDNRDNAEAQIFLSNLCGRMGWPSGHALLDLACGAGRHSIALADMGFQVVGVDLSPSSIAEAKSNTTSKAEFEVADMRVFSLDQKFDAILNLFTSFGYFEKMVENIQVLNRARAHLKSNGQLVIDFLNPKRVEDGLVEIEEIEKQGVLFNIRREITETHVVKNILFEDRGKQHSFREQVQLFNPIDFENMLSETGFFVENVFGSYQLDDFSADSDRQIIIARRE